jgi:hypothetical protein
MSPARQLCPRTRAQRGNPSSLSREAPAYQSKHIAFRPFPVPAYTDPSRRNHVAGPIVVADKACKGRGLLRAHATTLVRQDCLSCSWPPAAIILSRRACRSKKEGVTAFVLSTWLQPLPSKPKARGAWGQKARACLNFAAAGLVVCILLLHEGRFSQHYFRKPK